jgi:sugar/nucleoside kinase (ribokinase family)
MSIPDIFYPGTLQRTSGVTVVTGGAVANTGLPMNLFGVKTALMGRIGDDMFGDAIRRVIVSKGASPDALSTAADDTSSYSVIIALPGRDRIILHDPGANDNFGIDDIDFGEVGDADLFHFGYPQLMRGIYADGGVMLARIFREVKRLGVTTSMDVAYADPSTEAGRQDWKRFLAGVLPHTDIFAPSIEEALMILAPDEYGRLRSGGGSITADFDLGMLPGLAGELMEMGAAVVVIKCGARGMYVRTADAGRIEAMGAAAPAAADWASRAIFSASFDPGGEVKSATGAGDTSVAAFLVSLLRGRTIEETISISCAAGALSVSAFDSMERLVPIDLIMESINSGWPRLSVDGAAGLLSPRKEAGLYEIMKS